MMVVCLVMGYQTPRNMLAMCRFPSLFDYVGYYGWIDIALFDVSLGTDPLKVPPTWKKRRIP